MGSNFVMIYILLSIKFSSVQFSYIPSEVLEDLRGLGFTWEKIRLGFSGYLVGQECAEFVYLT